MQLPPGTLEGLDTRRLVAKLRKAIYGLKQAGRTWYQALYQALLDLGFKHANYNHGVFYARTTVGIIILAIHVNDCTITRTSQKVLDHYKNLICKRYAMMDLGPISWLLGIKVT